MNALVKKLEQESEGKKDVALKATKEKKDKQKKVMDPSDEDSDDEMALFVKRFSKFLKKGGFKKKSHDKRKSRKSRRNCYTCNQECHFIADSRNTKGKEEKNSDKHHKRDKSKKHRRHHKDQAHIGQEWNSDAPPPPLHPPNPNRMRESLLHLP